MRGVVVVEESYWPVPARRGQSSRSNGGEREVGDVPAQGNAAAGEPDVVVGKRSHGRVAEDEGQEVASDLDEEEREVGYPRHLHLWHRARQLQHLVSF